MIAEPTTQDWRDIVNAYPTGAEVVYWPVLCKHGRRVRLVSKAYPQRGQPVVHVEGINYCVHARHIDFEKHVEYGFGAIRQGVQTCLDNVN